MRAQGVRGRFVVGVDGSPASRSALRWALREAELHDATIEVVGAWGFPVYFGEPDLSPIEVDLESVVRHQLDRVLHDVVPADCPVPLHTLVRRAPPSIALLDAAYGADLLVVGSRGHSELADMVLGSVSLHCVAHAPCPVVVIHAGWWEM